MCLTEAAPDQSQYLRWREKFPEKAIELDIMWFKRK